MKIKFFLIFLFIAVFAFSQAQKIKIKAKLNLNTDSLNVIEEIIFHNTSNDTLSNIYLHNWANSYKNPNTPLSKRLLDDYDKSLYFSDKKDRGYSKILSIINKHNLSKFKTNENTPDIIRIPLKTSLYPNDSISLIATYIVKIPNAKFTKYGKSKNGYHLRFWHLVPAVYDEKWHIQSNYNMDDLYMLPTDYNIELEIPKQYHLITDLNKIIKTNDSTHNVFLTGTKRVGAEIEILLKNNYQTYSYKKNKIISNLDSNELDFKIKENIINRQLNFIKDFLGEYPHKKILLNKIMYKKNPVYGLNQLPKFLNPFQENFEFDIKTFKILTKKIIDNTIITEKRSDYWLNGGLQTFLMIKYVEKYYPEIKAIGNISKIWGIKSYHLSEIKFNEKYPFVYQFAMRKNLDQPLTTSSDSLSTFNRKIISKYKAGIGINYLDKYLGNNEVKKSIKEFYNQNKLSKTSTSKFKNILLKNTDKNLDWFFKDYLKTKKNIDYTIKKVKKKKDSIYINIKNKTNFNAPIALYGILDKKIVYKKWIGIDGTKTIAIPKLNYNRLSLNYEYFTPEFNQRDNWKNLKSTFLNRPLKLRFMKDIDDPYYNQLFYNFIYDYNYYDGLILGLKLSNNTLFKKKWIYKISPAYSIKSKQITGSFSFRFQNNYPESKYINQLFFGTIASTFHYAPDLSYTRISPYLNIELKRKNYREIGGKNLNSRYIFIRKENEPNTPIKEFNNYQIFNLRYNNSNIQAIKEKGFLIDFQYSNLFSKLSIDYRYRKFTPKKRQYHFRFYAGTFLTNNTSTDFFNFSLNRPSDYLFDYSYLGRSETSGVLSQQFIMAEGGFKSFFKNDKANQWIISTNNGVGLYKWVELYADFGLLKTKNQNPIFKYDSGIRINLVNNFLEFYFPLQSSNGFEPNFKDYPERIRFVLTINPTRIYNRLKRGFY
jgi:hypothetical protein